MRATRQKIAVVLFRRQPPFMNRPASSSLFVFALLAATGFVFWCFNAFRSSPAPVKAKAATSTRPRAVVLQKEQGWNEVTRDQAEGWKEALGNETAPHDFFTTSIVKSGESLIADMYESRPGEFVFTKLTPSVRTSAQGTRIIDVELDCEVVTFEGSSKKIFSRFGNMHSIGEGGGKSVGQMTKEGTYLLNIGAQITGDGDVQLQVNNVFSPAKKGKLVD